MYVCVYIYNGCFVLTGQVGKIFVAIYLCTCVCNVMWLFLSCAFYVVSNIPVLLPAKNTFFRTLSVVPHALFTIISHAFNEIVIGLGPAESIADPGPFPYLIACARGKEAKPSISRMQLNRGRVEAFPLAHAIK